MPAILSPFARVVSVGWAPAGATVFARVTVTGGSVGYGGTFGSGVLACGAGSVVDDYIGPLPGEVGFATTVITFTGVGIVSGSQVTPYPLAGPGAWSLPVHPGCAASPAIEFAGIDSGAGLSLPAQSNALLLAGGGGWTAGAVHVVQDIDETGPYGMPELYAYTGDGSGDVVAITVQIPRDTPAAPAPWDQWIGGEFATVSFPPP